MAVCLYAHHHYSLSRSQPIVLYPNAGEEYDPVLKEWVKGTATTDTEMCEFASQWVSECAAKGNKLLIGGCCRTSPATITALRKVVERCTQHV